MATGNGTSSGEVKRVYKAPGGKLLKASFSVEEGHVVGVRLYGDFFMHPEEAIEELERAVDGSLLDECELIERVTGFYESDVEVLGARPEDFVALLMGA